MNITSSTILKFSTVILLSHFDPSVIIFVSNGQHASIENDILLSYCRYVNGNYCYMTAQVRVPKTLLLFGHGLQYKYVVIRNKRGEEVLWEHLRGQYTNRWLHLPRELLSQQGKIHVQLSPTYVCETSFHIHVRGIVMGSLSVVSKILPHLSMTVIMLSLSVNL